MNDKPSTLEDFEKQLKGKMPNGASSLSTFEQQLKSQIAGKSPLVNPTTTPTGEHQNPTTKQVKVKKNIILSFPSDFTGCGHIRNIFPMTYLSNLYGKGGDMVCMVSPFYIRQTDILARSRTLFFQRTMNEAQYQIMKNYKGLQSQLKYKMVWDMDDNIWGKNTFQGGNKYDGVPDYNFGYKNIDDGVRKWSVEIMNLMDICCLSTQYLCDKAKALSNGKAKFVVMPNAVSKFFWGGMKRADRKKRIEKPRVLITSSPTHYNNSLKLKGDFDNAWYKWLHDSARDDKIELIVMGGMPFFFEDIKDKVKEVKWVSSFQYHTIVKQQKADILVAPLVPNEFNHSKSDIKYIEACAGSIPFIGTTFTNGKPSPYDDCLLSVKDDCSVDDIEAIVENLKEPDFHNKIKNEQFDMLEKEGRWTESTEYIKKWISILH